MADPQFNRTLIPVSGCIILDNQNRVLVLHRQTPTKVQWETPGGKVEPGESPAAAAARECMEEIGVEVAVGKALGENDFSEGDKNYHYYWFLGTLQETPKISEPEKFDKLEYFSWQQLKDMYTQLSANTKNLVSAYFKKEVTI